MTTIILGIALIIVLFLLLKKPKKTRTASKSDIASKKPSEAVPHNQIDFTTAYVSRWLFSYNEKDAFTKIKKVTDKKGYILLAKVRLLDLIEPMKGHAQYKTLFYKVQSKHVDFVVCDPKLVAKYVIELDDSSHNRPDRKQRDDFVDTALTSAGYKILHTRAISVDEITAFLNK